MRVNKLTVVIRRKPDEVFHFLLDPARTPQWIDFIDEEVASETPPKVGTVYRNRRGKDWAELVISELVQDKYFVFDQTNGPYHVRYDLTPVGKDATRLAYHEWVDDGEITGVFTPQIMQKLQSVLESEAT